MAKLERDSQRKKVYASVDAANAAVGKSLPEMKDVEAFVKKVLSRSALRRRFGMNLDGIEVKDGRGYGWTTGRTHEITVPRCERTDIYVLRALAYSLSSRYRRGWYHGERAKELNNRKQAWHAWEYCSILMDLVRYGLGATEAKALKKIFDEKRVRYSAPFTKTMTKDQKKAASERGKLLGAKMADRKARERFIVENPDVASQHVKVKGMDHDYFDNEETEVLFKVWK